MDRTVITWSPENWLTVTLMGLTGFVIVGFLAQLVFKAKGAQSGNGQ